MCTGRKTMNKYLAYFAISFKQNLREPSSVFYPLFFPLILLFFMGELVVSRGGDITGFVPLWATLILVTVSVFNIPIDITANREGGMLKRMYSVRVQMKYILLCLILSNLVFLVISMLVLGAAAMIVHDYRLQINWQHSAYAILAFFSLLPLSVLLSSIARTAKQNLAVSMTLYYPLCILSGLFIPYSSLPEKFQNMALYLPVAHVYNIFLAFTSDIGTISPIGKSAWILGGYMAAFLALLLVFRKGLRFLDG